jgi:hypothetical protein
MSKTPSDVGPHAPLSDLEFDELGELCDAHSPFDIDGLLGMFHAFGVAPGDVEPAAWLPVVFPNLKTLGADAERCEGFALRLYHEVMEDLATGQHQIPPPEEVDQCTSFAAGYTAGVELDPEWIDDEDAWALARDIAFLADRNDLLDEADIAEIEEELGPDPKSVIREELSGIVGTAHELFRSERPGAAQNGKGK